MGCHEGGGGAGEYGGNKRNAGAWKEPVRSLCMMWTLSVEICVHTGRILASDIGCVATVKQNTLARRKGLWVSWSRTSQTLMCTETTWGSCKNVDSESVSLGGA